MSANTDQRATPRVPAKIPIAVEGRDRSQKPFREETQTLLVNDGGALIALAAELRLETRVRVTNLSTGAAVECRVAWASAEPIQGRWSYGIALLGATEKFWSRAQ